MRSAITIGVLFLLFASPGWTSPVTLTGQVTYTGSYDTAETLYVFLYDTQLGMSVASDAISVAGTPVDVGFSLAFENTGVSDECLLFALLDVDNSGLGSAPYMTPGDVFSYYDGIYEPDFVSPAASQTGLDFALPTAEIRGYATIVESRTSIRVEVCSCLNQWCPWEFGLTTSGDYSLIVYAGDWFVRGVIGDYQAEYCYVGNGGYCNAAPDCTALTLGDSDVMTGIDFESPVPVDERTWGGIKTGYER